MKVKVQLIISHIAIALISLVILAVPVILYEANQLRKTMTETIQLRMENIEISSEAFFTNPIGSLDVVANYLDSCDTFERENVEAYLEGEADGSPEYDMLYFVSTVPVPQGGYVYSHVHWQEPADFDQTSRDWYKQAVRNQNDIALTSPYVDTRSGDVLITISKAYKKNGKLAGVIGLDLNISEIARNVDSLKLSEHGQSYIIAESGLYITHPDTDKIGRGNFFADNGFNNYMGAIRPGQTIVNLADGRYYFAARKLENFTNWTVVTYGPESELYRTIQMSVIRISSLAVFALFIAVFNGLLVSRGIVRPLKKVSSALLDISTGHADLTQRLDFTRDNEIGDIARGFNEFISKLQSIVINLKNAKSELESTGTTFSASTDATSSAIGNISNTISTVHVQLQNQNASVSETAGAVNQIASNIESLEKMIMNQSSGVSQASSAVEEMIGNISSVNATVEHMADSFSSLETVAIRGAEKQKSVNEKILEIEKESKMLQEANAVISSIASQTNLLAMNAAIEAAHAGDAGKGFSVVADEIRKLSETSSQQSKKIGLQLKQIKQSISGMVESAQESTDSFNLVSSRISETDQLVQQIKAAMEEQNAGSKQITDALQMMNDSTAEVKVASNEMAQGNTQILSEIRQLQDVTGKMNDSMKEMASGIDHVAKSGSMLDEISDVMEKAISEIGNEINQFTV